MKKDESANQRIRFYEKKKSDPGFGTSADRYRVEVILGFVLSHGFDYDMVEATAKHIACATKFTRPEAS